MRSNNVLIIPFLAVTNAAAQIISPFTFFNQTGQIPSECVDGYSAGTDTALYTIPYTYTQVLSIIGSFKNLTWSGNPDNTVSLNGTDNTAGTARTYISGGARVVETLTTYDKPITGPYDEVHTVAPVTILAANVSFYSGYEGMTAVPTCNGSATAFNFTTEFCATNATLTAGILHMLHLTSGQTVGALLGNQNFTSCAAISPTTTPGNATSGNTTTTLGSPTTVAFTGNGIVLSTSVMPAAIGAFAVTLLFSSM